MSSPFQVSNPRSINGRLDVGLWNSKENETYKRVKIISELCLSVSYYKHYATNPQVAGSIPDGVIGIFQ